MGPLVSIIVPAYNAEAFLRATLESVFGQTYTALDVIVVDDGSTDGTRDIVTAFQALQPGLRLISKPNGGVASARNAGLRAARGDYVAFLDADDLWHPEKIATQMAALRPGGGEGYVAAFSLHLRIDKGGRVTGKSRAWPFAEFGLPAHIVLKPVGNGSSLIVRRDVAIGVGGFDEDYVARGIGGCEDLDFELRVAAQYPIACVPYYHVGYRVYEGNMSSDRPKMARAVHDLIRRHVQLQTELSPWCRRMAVLKAYEYSISILRKRHWRDCLGHVGNMMAADPVAAVRFVAWDFTRTLWRAAKRVARKTLPRQDNPLYAELWGYDLRAWPDHRLDSLYERLSRGWIPSREPRGRNFVAEVAWRQGMPADYPSPTT
jgi:glycosyltransferase involved in cell wall biosynthesis